MASKSRQPFTKSAFTTRKRDYQRPRRHPKPSKLNFKFLLNFDNIDQNLQADYRNSLESLIEYFQQGGNVPSNVDRMHIVQSLCNHLPLLLPTPSSDDANASIPPISETQNAKDVIDNVLRLCRFVSLLCISCQYVVWNESTINLLLTTLIEKVLSDKDLFSTLIPSIPVILRTIGHVVFERGNLINAQTRSLLIATLIPLASPIHRNSVPSECRIATIHNQVNRLCIEYGIKKFPHSHNIATYDSSQKIRQYMLLCNQKKVGISFMSFEISSF